MTKISKRQKTLRAKQPSQPLPLEEAVGILKGFGGTKFDQSVEIAMRLGVDSTLIGAGARIDVDVGLEAHVTAMAATDESLWGHWCSS